MTDGSLRRQHRFTVLPEHLIRDRRISDRAMRLWCLLDRYAGANGQAFPKRSTLAGDLDCSVATVDRAILELVEFEWLAKDRREAGGVNDYTLLTGPEDVLEGVLTGEDTPTSEDTPSSPVTTPVLTGDATQKEASPKDQKGSETPSSLRSSGRRKPETELPDDFEVTDDMKAWFASQPWAAHVAHPGVETQNFMDHHRAKGSKFRDWRAAWQTWMRNAGTKYAQGASRAPQHPVVDESHRDRVGGLF